jgi:short-subunit dehydrogenase
MGSSRYPFVSALVTGASSGIGEAMVRRLAVAGVPTVVVARRVDRLQQLASELPGVEVLAADLGTKRGRGLVAERLGDGERPIDLLVNNAGFGSAGQFVDLDAERLADEVGLNALALTVLCRAAVSGMVDRGRGWLLNVSSVAAFQPVPRLAVYAATKAYVLSLSEALHEELRGTGVKVTALCPGLTRTEFVEVSGADADDSWLVSPLWMSADAVADTGLADAAKGRAVSVPGLTYKTFVATSSFMPRGIVRRAAGTMAAWRSPGSGRSQP